MTSDPSPSDPMTTDTMADDAEALLSEGDTRFRGNAASTQRHIRYWNAYVKSGGVTKSLVRGSERLGKRRWWRDENGRKDVEEDKLEQAFDGNMKADDHVVYSLNKKQRWRLAEAFQDFAENRLENSDSDSSDSDSSDSPPTPELEVTVALKDRVKFSADCRKILRQIPANSSSSAPELVETLPNRRYTNMLQVLQQSVSNSAEKSRDEGRERRRAGGQRDQGRIVKSRPKVQGHSRRCECLRCAGQSEVDTWRSAAQLENEDGERLHPQARGEDPADELRYVVEMPIQKRLVKKRGVTCEKAYKAQNVVIKGRKSGRSASAMVKEMEWMGDEEEEEEVAEDYEEEDHSTPKEYSLAEWMESNKKMSASPKHVTGALKKASEAYSGIDKSHIRYLDEDTSASPNEDDFVFVNQKKKMPEEEEDDRDSSYIEVVFPISTVDPQHLERVFNVDASTETTTTIYFEADSWPRSFVVDVSEEIQFRLAEEQKALLGNVFKEEGKTPIPVASCLDVPDLTKTMSRKKARARRYAAKHAKMMTYYLPTPLTSMKIPDVKCFLVFTEQLVQKNDEKSDVRFRVTVRSNLEKANISNELAIKDADNNNVDIREFVDVIINGLFEEKHLTTPSTSTDASSTSKGRATGASKQKVRVNRGMYQSAPSLDDEASKGVDRGLTPKDLDNQVRKMNIAGHREERKEMTKEDIDGYLRRGEIYCNICWISIGLDYEGCKDIDSPPASTPATALGTCISKDHWFCDSCWRSHLRQQIANGASALTCPEFDCGSEADLATMLRLLPWKRCNVFLRRLENRMVVDDLNAKWCPAEGCGCALAVDADVVSVVRQGECLPVSCPCGLVLCFHCLGEQHWPASCDEGAKYREARVKNGHEVPMFDGSYFGETAGTYVAKVKQCPHCKRRMEKGEGCDHMSCSCGKSYCWRCGQDFETAHHGTDAEGHQTWVGCTGGMDLEEVVLEEETAGSEEWYARAMFFRRYRRTNGWKTFNAKKFLKLDFNSQKVTYRKTEDIVKQCEALTESRRRIHQLVRRAFERVVETLQALEYIVVVRHYRKKNNNNNNNNNNNQASYQFYLINHVWFFLSRLVTTLRDGPNSKDAPKVEAEIRENLKEIKNAIGVIRNSNGF